MKKIILQFSLGTLFVLFGFHSQAQTSVSIYWVMDSINTWNACPPPVNSDLVISGNAQGYAATDSISLHVFWGDGTDSTFKTGLNSSGSSNFYTYANHWYTMAGTFNVLVIAAGPDGVDDTSGTGPLTVYSACTTVSGYLYADVNSNCFYDGGDTTFSDYPVTIRNGSYTAGFGYTDSIGYYSINVPQGLTGLTISADHYAMGATCPASGFYTFNSTNSMNFDFGIDCSNSNFDLFTYHAFSGLGAPGGTGILNFYAGNVACSNIQSTITLTLDPSVTYNGMVAGPTPTTISGNTLTWSLTMPVYSYNANGNFHATVSVATNTTAVVFDTACFDVTISPSTGDSYPANNAHNWCLIIGGPYDPNSKEVSAPSMQSNGNIAAQEVLTYTVNFQNTGTAPAQNIYLMDTLSSNLEVSTMKILASSHSMHPEFYDANIVRFDFPNINLPDSNANEPLSHGWVIYSIATKPNLVNGTEIKNTAYIYFDYNAPIVTNTTLNTVDITLGISDAATNKIDNNLFPNPASNNFFVEFEKEMTGVLYVYDATGKIVRKIHLSHTNTAQLSITDLAPGIYSVSIPGVELKNNRVQVIR
jgi:uncharacterized repeat protein (TIGR01451 family)